jgi:DNA helicase-2/ATP-dependent DNA helicase PcrA
LVVAPPGSGKTEVLAQRIVRLVQFAPDAGFKVLALSFTKSAAATMRRRVGDRLGEFTWRVLCTTYHAFCEDVLRSYGDLVGLPNDFTLYDSQEDRVQALAQGLVEEGLLSDASEIDRTAAVDALESIGHLKRNLVPPGAAPDNIPPRWSIPLSALYRAYELALSLNGGLDFDGVIGKAHELLRAQPEICEQYRQTYQYILIDEAQDTSTAQYELLKALCGDVHRNVLIVADPAQSIYAFAGASSRFIESFESDFSARRYELGSTFRCAREILRVAATLVPRQSREAVAQSASANGLVLLTEWDTEEDEASAIVDWLETLMRDGLPQASLAIEEDASVSPEQLVVVARSRSHLRATVSELDTRNHPYHFSTGEAGVFDSEEYTSVLYGIKVLANGHDIALARSLVACLRRSRVAPALGDYEHVLEKAPDMLDRLARDLASTAMAEPMAALSDAANDEQPIADILQRLSNWDPAAQTADLDHAELLNGDRELFHDRWVVHRNRPESLQRGWHGLLLELVRTPRPEAPGVRVLTVHAAKGLEFKAVAVAGLNDGSFPDFRSLNGKDLESERRLMYVAVTRASRALWLSRPKVRQTRFGGRGQDRSRFLAEMGFRLGAPS